MAMARVNGSARQRKNDGPRVKPGILQGGQCMAVSEREWMKAAEVCDIVGVPAYVLRSWEAEFPQLGRAEEGGSARLYGPDDVELVRRIRTLVFDEGLTLAGVRRQLDSPQGPVAPRRMPAWDDDTRQRLRAVRDGLRELLERLDSREVPNWNWCRLHRGGRPGRGEPLVPRLRRRKGKSPIGM